MRDATPLLRNARSGNPGTLAQAFPGSPGNAAVILIYA